MEAKGNYDSRAVNWAHPMNNSTHLPPKSPPSYSMFSSTSLFEIPGQQQQQQPPPGSSSSSHRRSPSAGYVQGSWLSSSSSPDIVLKRCSHRRSSSDSVAFVDTSYQYMNYLEHVTEEEDEFQEPRRGVSLSSSPATHRSYPEKASFREPFPPFQRQQQQQQQNNYNNNNRIVGKLEKVKKHVTLATPLNKSDRGPRNLPPTSFENRSAASESNSHSDDSNDERFRGDPEEGADCTATSSDQVDPKKAKRVLANRQSAQRSRVRKLQYISELEMNVNLLETEVASLSPKVGFFDRERALLSAENALLKQKLTALTKMQRLKEVYNETLKTEVQRLRQLQQTQQYSSQQQQQPLSPDAVEVQLRFSKLELGPPNLPKSPNQGSSSSRISFSSLYPGSTQPISISNHGHRIMRTSATAMSPPSCLPSSFMVHNSL